jgi:hypothetical protein
MASTSEHTFGNKLERGRNLQVALEKMNGYKPDNTALKADALKTFLDSIETANDGVAGKSQILVDERMARRIDFFGDAKQGLPGLRTLAGRVRDYVGSMPGGKKSPGYRQIQRLTQKIVNYHPPKKKVSGTPAANKKEISQSEASYGSMVQAGRDLAAAVAEIPGYNPAAADLQPALAGRNENVAKALVDARNVIAARAELYEGEQAGLRSQMQQAKAAVASQFGRRSPEYKSISGIRY